MKSNLEKEHLSFCNANGLVQFLMKIKPQLNTGTYRSTLFAEDASILMDKQYYDC